MEPNISKYSDASTARTCLVCARQRAENLAVFGVKSVLELCVGPSLKTLEKVYNEVGIQVTGNDIDERWKKYYPEGRWLMGDARKLLFRHMYPFDAIVVAPPLSKNCSGKREDSLSIDQVVPTYYDFLDLPAAVIAFVLPGRTLSIKEDRAQLHKLIAAVEDRRMEAQIVPLKNKVVKYVDLYGISRDI